MFKFFARQKQPFVKSRYPKREYNALISTAMLLTSDLQEFIDDCRRAASASLSHEHMERLILQLQDIDLKAKQNFKREIERSNEQGDMPFDIDDPCYVEPAATLVASPEAAIRGAMRLLEGGITNAPLIHRLILAEVDLPLQRWRVSLAINIKA